MKKAAIKKVAIAATMFIAMGAGNALAELEYKIPPMLETGGCVLGLDHRVPNGTPLANYRFYVRRAWEMLEGA